MYVIAIEDLTTIQIDNIIPVDSTPDNVIRSALLKIPFLCIRVVSGPNVYVVAIVNFTVVQIDDMVPVADGCDSIGAVTFRKDHPFLCIGIVLSPDMYVVAIVNLTAVQVNNMIIVD